jgi:hypothetical protein
MMQQTEIECRFNYYHATDVIEFIVSVAGKNILTLSLQTDSFIALSDQIAKTAGNIFEQVKALKAQGIKQDIMGQFDAKQLHRLIDIKKQKEVENG